MFDYMTVVNAWRGLMDQGLVSSGTPISDRNDAIRNVLYVDESFLTDAMIDDAFTQYLAAMIAELTSSS